MLLGDTLFVGGCGRFFEGTAAEMLLNMDRLSALPPESLVYCAHEYTESNYKFLAHVDPATCSARYVGIQNTRASGLPTVPTTIHDEIESNLFMHCRTQRLQEKLGTSSAEETMAKLRQMKNDF